MRAHASPAAPSLSGAPTRARNAGNGRTLGSDTVSAWLCQWRVLAPDSDGALTASPVKYPGRPDIHACQALPAVPAAYGHAGLGHRDVAGQRLTISAGRTRRRPPPGAERGTRGERLGALPAPPSRAIRRPGRRRRCFVQAKSTQSLNAGPC